MEYSRENLNEYLRRNTLHCASVGYHAGVVAFKERILTHKRQPKWMLEKLDAIIRQCAKVEKEMVRHRDEIDISDFNKFLKTEKNK